MCSVGGTIMSNQRLSLGCWQEDLTAERCTMKTLNRSRLFPEANGHLTFLFFCVSLLASVSTSQQNNRPTFSPSSISSSYLFPHSLQELKELFVHLRYHGRDESACLSAPWLRWVQLLSHRAHQPPGRLWKHTGLGGAHLGRQSGAQPGETAVAGPGPWKFTAGAPQERVSGGSRVQRDHPKGRASHRGGDLPGEDLPRI